MTQVPADSASDIIVKSVKIGSRELQIVQLPGLPSWELVSPAIQLLASNIEVQPSNRILLFGVYRGELAAHLIPQLISGKLYIIEDSCTSIKSARLTLSKNNLLSKGVDFLSSIEVPPEENNSFDTAIISLPKSRSLARKWLVQAYNALLSGGKLYLGGANTAGIQSLIRDAQDLFGKGDILAYKKGNRIARFVKLSSPDQLPDWSLQPGITPQSWAEFSVIIKNQQFTIHSLPGVFSFDQLDEGTSMLLNSILIEPGSRVLDLGCGYGVVGLYASSAGAGWVDMVDNNLLAIAASQETLSINNIENANAYPLDVLNDPIDSEYDLILSNPPFHTSHSVDYIIAHAMIRKSFKALTSTGKLVIVANRFIRYDRLIKDIFGNVHLLSKSGKFHVLSGLKSASG